MAIEGGRRDVAVMGWPDLQSENDELCLAVVAAQGGFGLIWWRTKTKMVEVFRKNSSSLSLLPLYKFGIKGCAISGFPSNFEKEIGEAETRLWFYLC